MFLINSAFILQFIFLKKMILNKKIPFKYIYKKIKFQLIYVILIAVFVKLLALQFIDYIPEMPLSIPAFIGTAISIILSFKLNQSYERWWEARKIWGAIVNDSRTLVLYLQSFLNKSNTDAINQITHRQIAWCYSLGQNLRGTDPLKNIDELLLAEEINQLKSFTNKPLGILQLNTLQLAELRNNDQLTDFDHVQLTNVIGRFSDAMGMAERIKNTVFPMTYRILLHFMIYIFVITLSLALGEIRGVFELPLLVALSSTFLLLEKTATHMQDPFENKPSDIPITSIARTIDINLREMIGDKNIPTPYKTENFYSL